jgi:hypothetical protein
MKEQHRAKIVTEYEAMKVKGQEATDILGVSFRQFGRIAAAYRAEGLAGIVQGNRGKEPWNKISAESKQQDLGLTRGKYLDYNDNHFSEGLNSEKHKICISRPTVYRIRRENRLRSPRKASSA